jgi:glycosyltransferase involved in cell wall biosynthesis
MKIALLCHNMHKAGGYVVGINVVKCLKKVASSHQFLLIAPVGGGYENIELPYGSKVVLIDQHQNLLARWKFHKFRLPALIKDFGTDVVFGMANLAIIRPGCKQAMALNDAHHVYSVKHYRRDRLSARVKKWFVTHELKRALPYVDIVFCQTPITKKRFADVFSYPEDKIRIMPSAVSEDLVKIDEGRASVPEILKQDQYFNMFYLTKYYTHKNLEILIKIFRSFPEKLKDVRCIITALPSQGRNARMFFDNIKKYKLEKQIISIGYVEQKELADYFINSDAVFFPTLLESFSSTYLEAMYFKTPILTSDLDFAHYVCDEAAIYFNPWDPGDVVEKILLLKNNNKLREELVNKGKNRICRFFISWDKIITDVITELETLVDKC